MTVESSRRALSPERRARWPVPPALVVGVYRRQNAAKVLDVLSTLEGTEVGVRLWALDEEAPELAPWTRGVGPGGRFALLNRLLTTAPVGAPDEHLVLLDDDLRFTRGDLTDLLRITGRLGLELAMASHDARSTAGHAITRAVPGLLARRTTFVEIGPVTVVGPSLRSRLTPFPERTPMGHGVDLEWTDLAREGHRLGIVDAVRIRHLGRLHRAYGADVVAVERVERARVLAERGAVRSAQLHATLLEIPRTAPRPARLARLVLTVPEMPRPLDDV